MDTKFLREIYAQYHGLNAEKDAFSLLVADHKGRFVEIMELTFPWSYWYEYPYVKVLALFIHLSGLEESIIEAAKAENPQQYIFDSVLPDKEIDKDDDFSDEEKSLLISLHMNNVYQMESFSMFSQSLSELVEKAKVDDNALFDAVLVDRSVVACAPVARRIQHAQMTNDESFMESLSKAITRTRPRRPLESNDDLRYMLEVADQLKLTETVTKEQLFDIFANDLELYDTDSKKDAFSGFKRLIERRNKLKAT